MNLNNEERFFGEAYHQKNKEIDDLLLFKDEGIPRSSGFDYGNVAIQQEFRRQQNVETMTVSPRVESSASSSSKVVEDI